MVLQKFGHYHDNMVGKCQLFISKDADNKCSLSHQPESCDLDNMVEPPMVGDPGRTEDYKLGFCLILSGARLR